MPRKPNNTISGGAFLWRLLRRDGVWYADGRVADQNLDKHSLGTRDRAEALERLPALDKRMAIRRGLVSATPPPSENGDVSIDDGWGLYLSHTGRAEVVGGACEATISRYGLARNNFAPFCAARGITTWSAVTDKLLEAYANQRARDDQAADATIFFEINLLKSVVKWLINEGKLPNGKLCRLRVERPRETTRYCYTQEEVSAIIAFCRNSPSLVWLANLVALLASTGVRIGEAVNLRWRDLDFAANLIWIRDERSNSTKRTAAVA